VKCPTCQFVELVERGVASQPVKLDLCPECKGIWFDGGELARVLGGSATDLDIPHDARPSRRFCPRCTELLYAFAYPQTYVTVDMCRACKGLWLDAKEFPQIKLARQQPRSPARREERDQPPGIKGALLRMIDESIESLKLW